MRPFSQIPQISRFSLIRKLKPLGNLALNEVHKLKPLWMKSHGPIIRVPGQDRFVELYNPADIGVLLRADGKMPLRPVIPLIDLAIRRGHLQASISHLNGTKWAEIRTKMQKIFLGPNAAAQFYLQQQHVCEQFVSSLQRESERTGMVKDFKGWACRFAAESVGKVLLNVDSGSFTDDPDSPGNRLCKTMSELFTLTAGGFSQPPWAEWFQTPFYKQWIHQHRVAKQLVEELISMYGFRNVNTKHSIPSPVHSELLAKQDITDEEAVNFAEELFIAGVESTGNALTFFVYNLAKHPDVQDKLHHELRSVQDEKGQVTPESFQQLSYLKACMKESMRVTPPTTGTVRVTSRELTLSGYTIPTGTTVSTGCDAIGLEQDYFADASVFRPERWLGVERQSIVPFAYLPFGHGARMCIGKRFAEQELMMAVATLINQYKIDLVNKNLKLSNVFKVFYSPDQAVDIRLKQH